MWKIKFIGLVAGLGLIIPLLAGAPALADEKSTTTTISVIPPGPITQGDPVTVTATVTVQIGNPAHSVEEDTVNFLTSSGACNGGTFGAVGAGIISSGDATLAPVLDTSTAGVICIRAVYEEVNLTGNHKKLGSQDEVTLVIELPPPPGIFTKELISGPNDNAGAPLPVSFNDPHDAGGILVNHPDSQHFEFKITVTNDGGDGDLDDLKILDVVGAEFDPDPDAEDAAIPEDGCTIAEGGDDVCDGIMVGGTGTCTASITPHDPERFLDPHFIHIEILDLDADETCEVTVWVKTDENPASVRDTGEADDPSNPAEKFEPTSCHLVMAPDLFDTFTLNEGIKVFDPIAGIRVLGPVGSLQLTCNFPD